MTRREQMVASVGLIIGGALIGVATSTGVGIALAVIGIAIGIRPTEHQDGDGPESGRGSSS